MSPCHRAFPVAIIAFRQLEVAGTIRPFSLPRPLSRSLSLSRCLHRRLPSSTRSCGPSCAYDFGTRLGVNRYISMVTRLRHRHKPYWFFFNVIRATLMGVSHQFVLFDFPDDYYFADKGRPPQTQQQHQHRTREYGKCRPGVVYRARSLVGFAGRLHG